MTTRATGSLRPTGNGAPGEAPGAAGAAAAQASLAVPALMGANSARTGPPVPSGSAASSLTRTGAPKNRRPRADCTADSAGGLTFDVRLGDGGPGATATEAEPADAAMLLRRRGGGEGPADAVRLPLGPAGADGTLRAVLPSIMSLPEGRWDAYLVLAGREPRRLLPGVHDLRSLIDRVPRVGRTWLGVRIPYATKFGNLTVRSWLRWPHAEAGGCASPTAEWCCRAGSTVRGSAVRHVSRRTPGTSRASPSACRRSAPPTPGGDGVEEEGAASEFTATLPFAALPATHRVWDLWLRPEDGAEPVRVARILDDVPDKRRIFSYPPQRVSDARGRARGQAVLHPRQRPLAEGELRRRGVGRPPGVTRFRGGVKYPWFRFCSYCFWR